MTRRAPSRASAGVLASPGAWWHAGFQGRVGSLLGRWVEEERDRRTGFLLLPVAFALGILAYFAASDEPAPWAGPVLLLIAAIFAIRFEGVPRAIAIALAMMAAGFTAGTWRSSGSQRRMNCPCAS